MGDHGVGLFNRTHRARFVMYSTDGLGRDTYISYNNGGFWKDNIKTISLIDKFDVPQHKVARSLRKNVAPFKYWSDGSGRDSYVIHESGGLKRDHKPLQNYHLKDFLRTPESAIFNFRASPLKEGVGMKTRYVSKKQFNQNMQLKKLEKGLKDRLYYSERYKFLPSVEKKRELKYKDMLRSYDDNGFPKITKSFQVENPQKIKNIQNQIKEITNYPDKHLKNLQEVFTCDKLKMSEMDNLAKRHFNFSKTATGFRSKSNILNK